MLRIPDSRVVRKTRCAIGQSSRGRWVSAYWWPLTALGLIGLVGCGRSQGSPAVTADFSVHDSAGVRIAVSTGPAWKDGEGWKLSAKPTAQIGVAEGDARYEFSRINAGALLPDGGFVVGDASFTVRAYSARGFFRWTEGRKGRGPGEFTLISSIRPFSHDSLLVFDGPSLRVSVITDEGGFVRSANLAEPGAIAGGARAALPLDDGTMIVVTGGSTALLDGPLGLGISREEDPARHVGAMGELLGAIGPFPGGEWYITEHTMGPAPFAHHASYATRDSTLLVGTGDAPAVEVYSPAGRLVRSIRWTDGDLSVTKTDVATYRNAQVAMARDAQQRRITEARLASMPMPKQKPAYSRIAVDRDGDLWVGAYGGPGFSSRRWSVFSPDGRLLGTVAFPDAFRVLDIGSRSVLGVWTDDVGVEHVAVYAIHK